MDVDATPEGPAPDPREELKEWPEFVSSLDRIVLFDVLDVYLDMLDLYRYFLIYCLISVSKRIFFRLFLFFLPELYSCMTQTKQIKIL